MRPLTPEAPTAHKVTILRLSKISEEQNSGELGKFKRIQIQKKWCHLVLCKNSNTIEMHHYNTMKKRTFYKTVFSPIALYFTPSCKLETAILVPRKGVPLAFSSHNYQLVCTLLSLYYRFSL